MSRLLTVTLDMWKAGSDAPRGVIQLKRQYAHTCAQLVKRGAIKLHFAGESADKYWLQKDGLLDYGIFHRFRIPGRLQPLVAAENILPVNWLLGNPDIYHSFSLYPFQHRRMRVAGTLIDFVPMRVPECVPLGMLKEQVQWCQWASKHPKAVWFSISEQVKQDAIALARVHPDQVVKVQLCADEDVFPVPSDHEVDRTLKILGIHRPYILCVNTFNPRKNHNRLLQAWVNGQYSQQGWSLILVGHPAGNPLTDQIRSGLYNGVSWSGYLPRHQVIHLYYGCEGFTYPSLYEGFGIPVAEAVVAGKAIMTSHRSVMVEITGAGAVYVDPWDTESVEKGLSTLISDEARRQELGAYNFHRRELFSIDRLADDLLKAYQSLFNG